MIESRLICGVRVDAVNYSGLAEQVIQWARRGESRMLCFSSVHMIMEAYDRPEYRRLLLSADVVTPDGMPLVWGLRLLGLRYATRVYGPDFSDYIARTAERENVPIALYGGSTETLRKLVEVLLHKYPRLKIAYAFAPPFRTLTAEERDSHIAAIRDSGAQIVLVGLGCPKQEQWMAEHRNKIPAVLLGVGAAFDFLAGVKKQAPRWMMAAGLEWLFRLMTEPRRLWLRYLAKNPRFVPVFLLQLLRTRVGGASGL